MPSDSRCWTRKAGADLTEERSWVCPSRLRSQSDGAERGWGRAGQSPTRVGFVASGRASSRPSGSLTAERRLAHGIALPEVEGC